MNIKDGQIMDFTKHAAPVADPLLVSDAPEAVKSEAPKPPLLESKVEVNNGIIAPPFFATPPAKKPEAEKKSETTEQLIQTHQQLLIPMPVEDEIDSGEFESLVLDDAAPAIQSTLVHGFRPEVAARAEENERLVNAQNLMNAVIESRDKLLIKKIMVRLEMLNEQAELELTAALKGQINALRWVLKTIESSK